MGKSSKKLKSERINAIRKQYDAFLEEDKKRKDRNEYILERLDKIRTSSAIVQLRNAPKDYFGTVNQNKSIFDRKDYMEKILPMYEKSQYCFQPVINSNAVSPINEQTVMTEISKKYILIPRHTNIVEYNDSYPMVSKFDDSGDWRSKYRILEELKQNEKEHTQPSNLDNDLAKININNKELNDNNTIKEPNLPNRINNPQNLLSKFNEEAPEKCQDNSEEIACFEPVNSHTENETPSLKTETVKQPSENSENTLNLKQAIEVESLARNIDNEEKPMTLKSPQTSPINKENIDFNEELVNESYVKENDRNTNDLTEKEKIQTEYEMKLKPEGDSHFEEVQYSNINIENQNPTEISLKTENYQLDKSDIEVYEEKENNLKRNVNTDIQHGNNILNDVSDEKSIPADVNEHMSVDNTNYIEDKNEMHDINKDQEVAIEKNENIENQIESQEEPKIVYVDPGEQEFDNIVNDTQIDEFEAEQTEMFYSDPNATEYAYDQTGSVNPDYTNEGYAQDENYGYYEGTPQQQVYSGEINDHEEATEQYDPHYEAQYTNYEEEEQINPNTEQYEAEENINPPQIYDRVQFEEPDFNVVKEVEGQLDAEQNYIDSTNQDENVNNIIDEAVIPEDQVAENQTPAPVN